MLKADRKSTTRKRQSEKAITAVTAAGMDSMASGHRNERIKLPRTAIEAGTVKMRVETTVLLEAMSVYKI